MTPAEFEKLRTLADKYRIQFRGPTSPERWPPCHKDTFSNVQQLGTSRYAHYCESIDVESTSKPWRGQIKRRADRLASVSARCELERRNEAGWRKHLEPIVFERFAVEVAW